MNAERNSQKIFIVGVGRSGTSLLMTLLNGHSEIAFTPETHFLRFYFGDDTIKRHFESKGAQIFKSILEKDNYFERLNISAADLLQPYINGQKKFDLHDVYLEILDQYLARKGKQFIGDKDPRYFDYLPTVKAVCPDAKIIHIYRDIRDVVASKMKAEWSAHRPYWVNAVISQMQMKRGRGLAKTLFGQNVYELSYESLVSNPTEALTNLLAFLDLKFEPEMLNLKKSASELVDENEMQWKDNTFKPIQNSNFEKWRKTLTTSKIRAIEIICKDWFKELGYEYSGEKMFFLKEVFLKLFFGLEGFQKWFYERKLRGQMRENLKSIK